MHKYLVAALLAIAPMSAKAITVDLSVNTTVETPNDMFTAVLYVEAQDANPAEATKIVNRTIQNGIDVAKGSAAQVKVKTGNASSYPVYGKADRKIDGWRVRSSIILESRSAGAMSDCITAIQKKQPQLMMESISASPSDETRAKYESMATQDALKAFEAKAKTIAEFYGKKHTTKHINVGGQSFVVPMRNLGAKAAIMSAMEAMPIEAGESKVNVTISGQVEIGE